MRAVNLLPREEPRSTITKSNVPIVVGVVAAMFVTTILCAGFLLESATVASKRNDLDAARAELALVPPPPPKQSTGDASLAGVAASRTTALQQALDGRIAWDRVLRDVSLVLPGDVWLNQMTLSGPAITAGQGGGFSMSGNAYSHEGVARLLSRLALVPDLQNVLLDHSNQTEPGKHGVVDFKIVADIRQAGATS